MHMHMQGVPVLGIDPGITHGCKYALVSVTGEVKATGEGEGQGLGVSGRVMVRVRTISLTHAYTHTLTHTPLSHTPRHTRSPTLTHPTSLTGVVYPGRGDGRVLVSVLRAHACQSVVVGNGVGHRQLCGECVCVCACARERVRACVSE